MQKKTPGYMVFLFFSHIFTNVLCFVKMAAHSSMDSSCVSVLSGPARSSASGGPGPDRSSSQNVDHCSQFFSHLLKWNPTWFLEAGNVQLIIWTNSSNNFFWSQAMRKKNSADFRQESQGLL